MEYSELRSRLGVVRERIEAACLRSGRQPDSVTIVAVTKSHPPTAVQAARAVGLEDVGENRVQELESKVAVLGRDAARWHLIGHLQRNKVRKAIEHADLIHSVDSVRLAEKLSEEGVATGRVVRALVQVNVSGEESKGGIEGDGAIDQVARICGMPSLEILGLMTMAPFTDDVDRIRSVFAATRKLSDSAVSLPGYEARYLSMGMSGDFEVAVEEGSTLVRLGTVLFGERSQ